MKQPEARQHAEAELEELLDQLVAELEATPFEVLWDRFMEERKLLRWTRTVSRADKLETVRGPQGGAFTVQTWGTDDAEDMLHIFVSAQADYEMCAEGNRDTVVRKGA